MCRQCLDYVWNIHLGVYPHCWTSVSPVWLHLFLYWYKSSICTNLCANPKESISGGKAGPRLFICVSTAPTGSYCPSY